MPSFLFSLVRRACLVRVRGGVRLGCRAHHLSASLTTSLAAAERRGGGGGSESVRRHLVRVRVRGRGRVTVTVRVRVRVRISSP